MDDPVARLAFYYSEHAEAWERELADLIHPLGLRLLDGLPTDAAQVVLDLGTGSGTLLPAIAARAPSLVVGIDRAEGMVRRAAPSFARAVADATRLPLADASVDAAILGGMTAAPVTSTHEGVSVVMPGNDPSRVVPSLAVAIDGFMTANDLRFAALGWGVGPWTNWTRQLKRTASGLLRDMERR